MRPPSVIFFILLALLLINSSVATPVNFSSTTAVTGNIIVFSGEARERNLCLHHVEVLRKEFATLTGIRGYEKIPIILLLHSHQVLSEYPSLRCEMSDDQSLKLQVDLTQRELDSFDLDETLITAFLLQVIYENNTAARLSVGTPVFLFPSWLTVGLTRSARRGVHPETFYSFRLKDLQKQPSLSEFLHQEPPWNHSLTLDLYCEHAQLLVETALASTQDRLAFLEALQSLSSQVSSNFWPEGWDQKQVETHWSRLMKEKVSWKQREEGLSAVKSLGRLQCLMITNIYWKKKHAAKIVTHSGVFTVHELVQQVRLLKNECKIKRF